MKEKENGNTNLKEHTGEGSETGSLQPEKETEHLSIGCTNFLYLSQIMDALELIPFQHIYRMLEEGELDAVIGFQEPASAKVADQYRKLTNGGSIAERIAGRGFGRI